MKRGFLMVAGVAAVLLFAGIPAGSQTKQEVSREKILGTGSEWQQKYDSYEPDADMMGALKAGIGADIKIDVYLGLWCPDSRNNVPKFIKILDHLGAPIPTRYFDVPRKSGKEVKFYVEELQVDRVPTFIFYKGIVEIGRIVENPKTGMLEDSMDIVLK